MTNYKKLIHFFGEMDLDLTQTPDKVYKKAFDIAENCGYMVTKDYGWDAFNPNLPDKSVKKITLFGREGEVFCLWFKNDEFKFITSKTGKAVRIPNSDGTGYGGYF